MKYIKTFEYLTHRKTIEDLEREYKFFHLTQTDLLSDSNNKQFTFTPRTPEYPYGWETSIIEDDFTERVSLGKSVSDCLYALPEEIDDVVFHIYGTKQTEGIISIKDKFKGCPNGYGKNFDLFKWIDSLPEEDRKEIIDYLVDMGLSSYETGVSDLPEEYKMRFKFCVPDVLEADEYWSLEPIVMDYLGYIKHEGLWNVYDTNYLKKVVPIID